MIYQANEKLVELKNIEEQIHAAQFEDALKKLKSWAKNNKPTDLERLKLSELYFWLGEVDKAKKVLGPPRNYQELSTATPIQLKLQIRHCFLLMFIGAKYTALIMINDLAKLIRSRKKELKNDYPEFFFSVGNIYYAAYLYKKSLNAYDIALKYFSKENKRIALTEILVADCFYAQGYIELAHELIDQAIEKKQMTNILRAIAYYSKGDYYLFSNQYKKAKKMYLLAKELFGQEVQTKDYAYLVRSFGVLALKENKKSEAIEHLMNAKERLSYKGSQATALQPIIYWLELIDPELTSLYEKIGLRCHHLFTPYAYLSGKKWTKSEKSNLPFWIQEKVEKTCNDCWLIENNIITPIDYQRRRLRSKSCIDLFSGVITVNEKIERIMSGYAIRVVSAVIGAGSFGIYELALVDTVYRQNSYNFDLDLDKLKKIMASIKKYFPFIKKRKGYYYFEMSPDFDFSIIIPMNVNESSLLHYVFLFKKEFSRRDIEEMFKIPLRTALNWIKDWKEEGQVLEKKEGKISLYYRK